MVYYFDDGDVACFNGHSFRLDKKTGYYLSSAIIDGTRRKRLHVYVWEYYNGKVPSKMHVHHIDGDKRNNEIENLVLLSAEEHERIHGNTLSAERRKQMGENVVKNAMPKAKEWHSTAEGKAWHSQQAKNTAKNLSVMVYECSNCGALFETKKRFNENQNRFCSNRCKAAYRRKSGLDDIVKICER